MPSSTPRKAPDKFLLLTVIACVVFYGTAHLGRSTGASPSRDSGPTAGRLLQWSGMDRGVCVVLGPDSDVALELARDSQLLVHVRDPAAETVTRLQRQADEAGFGIQRLALEQGRLDRLPYVENIADLLVAQAVTPQWLQVTDAAEVLRVLRPGGVALIGAASPDDQAQLKALMAWATAANGLDVEVGENLLDGWIKFEKPALAGVDEWTHWEKSPDNNPVSTDQQIKAPYMTQFMAEPFYIGMPSVTTIAGGRTFLAIGHIAHHPREWNMLNKLIARNGYNGTVLWERDLPTGYLVHRSAFVATDDTFYMMDGDHLLALDARTGRQETELHIPGLAGEWKWISMQDDVLYVLAGEPGPGAEITKGDRTFGGWSWSDLSKGYYGKRISFTLGDTLAAYDLTRGQLLWKHTEGTLIDARGMAMLDDQLFLYCPDRHLRCLATKSGQVLWTNNSPETLELIEEPGRGLTSTPGFRTQCITVATPRALIVQGQTRMNVVAVSTDSGNFLWTKKKITNNPNAIFVDGHVVLGVGPGGNHVVLDPVSGEVKEELPFQKRACTRLTASTDSFFCRGEGLLRFDRQSKNVLLDGSVRPACNDGAMPANGLLYLGPWQCDCNLSLIGRVAKCSAGDFQFGTIATEDERLEIHTDDLAGVASLPVSGADWPTYRANNQRSAGTPAQAATTVTQRWQHTPSRPQVPTAATAAGGLIFVAGEDGKVRALHGDSGETCWEYATSSPIKYPPTIWSDRAYIGCGDGWVYALEAATGRLLWRFRAAPSERHIVMYGSLTSTWPVNSGVLVEDGIAYFAAGIIDHDGTHVYALDAVTGQILWQNNSSGHLHAELRKGVSVQGNLTIRGDQLLLAGGNQVSPAAYDLATGHCLADPIEDGYPKTNHGKFVGVFQDNIPIAGGRILYSSPENVSTKGSFLAYGGDKPYRVNYGGVPPAWDEHTFAMVNYKHGRLTCCEADKVAELIETTPGSEEKRRRSTVAGSLSSLQAIRWQSDLDQANKFEAVSLAVSPATIVAVLKYQSRHRAQTQWYVVAFNAENGESHFEQKLTSAPLPDGLLVDRDGQIIVCMLNGEVQCLGPEN